MAALSPDFAALVSAVGDRYTVEREVDHGGMATGFLAVGLLAVLIGIARHASCRRLRL